MLIGLTSTRDAQGLEKLSRYDEGDIIRLVRQRIHQLRDFSPDSSEATCEHQIALIRSIFELCSGARDRYQSQLLDISRTFRENRLTYLSILDIDAHATIVDISEVLELAGQAKVFQLQPKVDLHALVNPDYLPIRPRVSGLERLLSGKQFATLAIELLRSSPHLQVALRISLATMNLLSETISILSFDVSRRLTSGTPIYDLDYQTHMSNLCRVDFQTRFDVAESQTS